MVDFSKVPKSCWQGKFLIPYIRVLPVFITHAGRWKRGCLNRGQPNAIQSATKRHILSWKAHQLSGQDTSPEHSGGSYPRNRHRPSSTYANARALVSASWPSGLWRTSAPRVPGSPLARWANDVWDETDGTDFVPFYVTDRHLNGLDLRCRTLPATSALVDQPPGVRVNRATQWRVKQRRNGVEPNLGLSIVALNVVNRSIETKWS